MDKMKEIPEDIKNRYQALYLMDTVGLESVWIKFEQFFPPYRLQDMLRYEEKNLKRKWSCFSQDQLNVLYPTSGIPSSTNYDHSLMIKLLENFALIKKPKNGFHQLPQNSDTSDGADLARIQYVRNKLAHPSINGISTSSRDEMIAIIKPAAERLSKKKLDEEFKAVLEGLHIEIRCAPAYNAHGRSVVQIKQLTVVGISTVLYIWPNLDSISSDMIISYISFSVFEDIVSALKGSSQDQIKYLRELFTYSPVNANNTNIRRKCSYEEGEQFRNISAKRSCMSEDNNLGTCTSADQGVNSQLMDRHSADRHNQSTYQYSIPLLSGGFLGAGNGSEKIHASTCQPKDSSSLQQNVPAGDSEIIHNSTCQNSIQLLSGGFLGAGNGSEQIHASTCQPKDSSSLQQNVPGCGSEIIHKSTCQNSIQLLSGGCLGAGNGSASTHESTCQPKDSSPLGQNVPGINFLGTSCLSKFINEYIWDCGQLSDFQSFVVEVFIYFLLYAIFHLFLHLYRLRMK